MAQTQTKVSSITKNIDVNVPLQTAYNQWTQFEEFPKFMEGVESIQQLDDKHLHWKVNIAGHEREFDATIINQVPDKLIAWQSDSGPQHGGRVIFEPLSADSCRITLEMEYVPEGFLEKVGDFIGAADARVEGDLQRFKEFIESRGSETGAWRGEIH